MKATLCRLSTSDQGTFGKLTINNFVWFTGELPWQNNRSNLSCVPKGLYFCSWTYSQRFKRMMYLINNVPSRSGIRIHSANLMGDDTKGWKRQLNGCLSLGERLGTIEGQKALLLSKPAVRRFEEVMEGKSFTLEII